MHLPELSQHDYNFDDPYIPITIFSLRKLLFILLVENSPINARLSPSSRYYLMESGGGGA